jgi:glycosyltransferase involved in cell wall biosynthesis
MEEVNSHIEYGDEILLREFESLNIKGGVFEKETDHYTRLQAYEESDYILCPSEFVRRSFLSKGFAPERLLKVNFGFPAIETGNSKVDKPHHAFRMLYVGQLHYRKGLRYAIEAFRKLNHPNKEFIIVGPKTPITGLENTQIPPGVVFTGTLKGEDLKNEYRKASVFVLPSLEEGLALVQGEALAFGVPLLITTNTGGDDIIENGKEGFIVEPASIDSLADRMQEMADDRFLLERMSANALVTAKTLGSWDIAAGRLISQLSDVLHHKTVNEVIV